MSSTTAKVVSSVMQQQLKRKVFKDLPHNILVQFSDRTISSLPESFIKELPTAPDGLLKITLMKSSHRCPTHVQGTINALGLGKRHHYIYHKNTPTIRGMIHKLRQYVKVDELPIDN